MWIKVILFASLFVLGNSDIFDEDGKLSKSFREILEELRGAYMARKFNKKGGVSSFARSYEPKGGVSTFARSFALKDPNACFTSNAVNKAGRAARPPPPPPPPPPRSAKARRVANPRPANPRVPGAAFPPPPVMAPVLGGAPPPPAPPPFTNPVDTGCAGKNLDIAFIIDASRRTQKDDFKKGMNALKKFIKLFIIRPTNVRIAALTYGSQVNTNTAFGFNKYKYKSEVLNGFNKFIPSFLKNGTSPNTMSALVYARKNFFRIARKNVKKFAFIITNGSSINSKRILSEIAKWKSKKVEIIAIGVGKAVKTAKLKTIASAEENVFKVDNYRGLKSVIDIFRVIVCLDDASVQAGNPVPKGPVKTPVTNSVKRGPMKTNVMNRVKRGPMKTNVANPVKRAPTKFYPIKKVPTFQFEANSLNGGYDPQLDANSLNGGQSDPQFDADSLSGAPTNMYVANPIKKGPDFEFDANRGQSDPQVDANSLNEGQSDPQFNANSLNGGQSDSQVDADSFNGAPTNMYVANPIKKGPDFEFDVNRAQAASCQSDPQFNANSLNGGESDPQFDANSLNGAPTNMYVANPIKKGPDFEFDANRGQTDSQFDANSLNGGQSDPQFDSNSLNGGPDPQFDANSLNGDAASDAANEADDIGQYVASSIRRGCLRQQADVAFIIDASRSILRRDFNTGIAFLKTFIQMFTIQPDYVRVAAVSFGAHVIRRSAFGFRAYSSKSGVLRGFNRFIFDPSKGSSTNTGSAIAFARQKFFRYARKNVKKMAFVITDGRSRETQRTITEAGRLKREGVEIAAIGVGNDVNIHELKAIASRSEYVFRVNNYDALKSIISSLSAVTCIVTPPRSREPCNGQVIDFNFIFDSDESEDAIEIIETLVSDKEFNGGNNGKIQVGIITGPCPKPKASRMNQFRSLSGIAHRFQAMKKKNMSSLMSDFRQHAFKRQNGGRRGARRLGAVFFKNQINDGYQMMSEAKIAYEQEEIEIFVITQESMISETILETIASGQKDHVFHTKNVKESIASTGALVEKICSDYSSCTKKKK